MGVLAGDTIEAVAGVSESRTPSCLGVAVIGFITAVRVETIQPHGAESTPKKIAASVDDPRMGVGKKLMFPMGGKTARVPTKPPFSPEGAHHCLVKLGLKGRVVLVSIVHHGEQRLSD